MFLLPIYVQKPLLRKRSIPMVKKKNYVRTSLAVQWLRLPIQGAQVPPLIRELDPMCSSEVQSLSRVQLCDPVDCSLPGSSVHGILQARILEWVAISFSKGCSWPRDLTQLSRIVGKRRRFNLWATREALKLFDIVLIFNICVKIFNFNKLYIKIYLI